MTSIKDKRILITGGTGFIGKNLVKALKKQEFKNITSVGSKECNLLSYQETQRLFKTEKPQIVINLAAKVGGIADIQKHPADFYYENMVMCTSVLEHCRKYNVEKLVAIGTNCSYPANAAVPFKEKDLFNGFPQKVNASYGIVKRAFYQQCLAYWQQYGQKFIYLIPANAYGVGDHFDEESGHVIPSLIKKFIVAKSSGGNVTLWGSGNATREFMYIDDVCETIVKAILLYDDVTPLNLSSGTETTIKQVAKAVTAAVGYGGEIIWDVSKPEGYLRKCLDITKMKKYLGESDFISLNDGIVKTVEWIRKNNIFGKAQLYE